MKDQSLRIIGGCWRGRKLSFPGLPGLRPSPDRVRETLFNWLVGVIHSSRCLDLFAGSGALGLEAASRGAAEVVMVDKARVVIEQLRRHRQALQAEMVELVQTDALGYLQQPGMPFNVVFLDPPYRQGLLEPCCRQLAERGWLAEGAYIYLEAERELGEPALPEGWTLHRSKTAGQVGYHLAISGETD